jgi:hypothetical protein
LEELIAFIFRPFCLEDGGIRVLQNVDTKLYGITSQKTAVLIFAPVKAQGVAQRKHWENCSTPLQVICFYLRISRRQLCMGCEGHDRTQAMMWHVIVCCVCVWEQPNKRFVSLTL